MILSILRMIGAGALILCGMMMSAILINAMVDFFRETRLKGILVVMGAITFVIVISLIFGFAANLFLHFT